MVGDAIAMVFRVFIGGQTNRTGTSTRPPHPPHTAPCPYARGASGR